MSSIYDVLHDPENDAVQDWRELISRVAKLCIDRTYADHGVDKEHRWSGHFTRRVLEDALDTTLPPISWADVQSLTQAALMESVNQSAIVGAALVMTWPASPAGFEDWPERAIALSSLRLDDGGIDISPLAREIDRRLRAVRSEPR